MLDGSLRDVAVNDAAVRPVIRKATQAGPTFCLPRRRA